MKEGIQEGGNSERGGRNEGWKKKGNKGRKMQKERRRTLAIRKVTRRVEGRIEEIRSYC